MTLVYFNDIIIFTQRVKAVIQVKLISKNGTECLENKFLKIPNVQKFDFCHKTQNGCVVLVEMNDGYEFRINLHTMQDAYPSTVLQLVERLKESDEINVLVAPYISERTAELCEKNGIGYFDYVGNCWFIGHSLYLSEKGNKNLQPKRYKANSVFERSSVVSSMILRELFVDISKPWRLKHLAEKVNCSIGLVSKVMNYLLKNAWVQKTLDGYLVLEPEEMLKTWSEAYHKKEVLFYSCYSLDAPGELEEKLRQMKKNTGIECWLTGFSGGVRYAPVVRYNKVHLYIAPEDIREAMEYLEMKEVDGGANVILFPVEHESCVKDSRIINGDVVVSPVQAYLDCMSLKGRGEELAEAILRKEILNGNG